MAEILESKEVFKTKVNERLNAHPNVWTGEDSVVVVRNLVVNLKDDQGNPITLTSEEEDLIQLASRPTNEVQLRVIKSIVQKRKVTMDSNTEKLIKRVVSPTGFKIELAKAGKITDTGEGGLKDLLG